MLFRSDLIMHYVSSVSYSMIINSEACGNIISLRGIRQRDPFSNDSLLFCKANDQECQQLVNILNSYEVASGHKINTDESLVFFSLNIPQEIRESVLNTLGPMQDSRHNKYLGLPFIIGKSKSQVFAEIKDQVAKKLTG